MVHPQMKAKNAELPDRIMSMEDAKAVDSSTLLLVILSVALSPVFMMIRLHVFILIVIGTTSV